MLSLEYCAKLATHTWANVYVHFEGLFLNIRAKHHT